MNLKFVFEPFLMLALLCVFSLQPGKNPKICLAVLTEYRRVTGGQTDILQHSSRYAASRGKKSVVDIGDTV